MKPRLDDTQYIKLPEEHTLPKLGVLAGGGSQTRLIIDKCQEQGRPYFILGIEGSCEVDFVKKHPHAFVNLGSINGILKHFKRVGAEDVIMVGSVHRPEFSEIKLDWRGILWLLQYQWLSRKTNQGDDSLLSFLARKIEGQGYKVVGAKDILVDSLVEHKMYTQEQPSIDQMKDILMGFEAAKVLGEKDLGQGVIVHNQSILMEEDKTGTNAMIEKTEEKGAILVKACKPQQNKNIDLPAIGADTVKKAIQNKLAGIAIEAEDAFFFEQDEAIELADQKGLFIVGIKPDEASN